MLSAPRGWRGWVGAATLAVLVSAGGVVPVTAPVTAPVPAAAALAMVDCPRDEPPYIDVATCGFGGGRQVDQGPFRFDVPEGAGGGCSREDGLPNDADPEDLNDEGPAEISCEWTGVAGPGADGVPRGSYNGDADCYLLHEARRAPDPEMVGYREDLAEEGLVYRASCFPPPAHDDDQDGATSPEDLGHWRSGMHGGEHDPDGAIWGGPGELVVLEEAPVPDDPEPGLVQVWAEAMDQLEMHGPAIVTAPPHPGLVRLPTWLWTEDTEQTWPEEPLPASASGGGWTVEAWAEPQQIEWHMGDGREPHACDGPGVAWQAGMDVHDVHHPPEGVCRYTYLRPSRAEPGGVFEITGVTTWRVWWHINGEFDNDVEIEVGTTTSYRVNEVQVLIG